MSPALTVPIRADFNGDGVVDAADYTVWRDALGQTGPGLAADANGDEAVDETDYAIWTRDFGASSGPTEADVATATPEPGAITLALLAMLPLARRRR